jgi:Domain of unknown function (DUF4296)
MMRIILYTSLILIASSCGNKTLQPKQLVGYKPALTSATIVNIGVDLHLLASAENNQLLSDSSKSGALQQHQTLIFKKYNTNSKAYNKAYTYYTQNTDTIEKIYDDIINKLSVLQANTSN